MDEFPYQSDTVTLNKGDLLVVYSDGIPDATNEFDHPFGEDRLISLIREYRDRPVVSIIEGIIEAVKEHEGETEQLDDLTLVVVKRES
jgi:serine phosphatase RsbU (regulator of sigma subunit)